MAMIKKKVLRRDVSDQAFWDEFYWQEHVSALRAMMPERNRSKDDLREVTVTIEDQMSGEKWRVRGLMRVAAEKKRMIS